MDGLAVKELINGRPVGVGGGVVPVTTTCVVAFTLPVELEAVRVYTVVVVGDTALVPDRATLPMPWSILTEVAPVTVQSSSADCPDEIFDGLALKELITGWLIRLIGPQPAKHRHAKRSTRTILFMVHLPTII